jgi:hypothetical protein
MESCTNKKVDVFVDGLEFMTSEFVFEQVNVIRVNNPLGDGTGSHSVIVIEECSCDLGNEDNEGSVTSYQVINNTRNRSFIPGLSRRFKPIPNGYADDQLFGRKAKRMTEIRRRALSA